MPQPDTTNWTQPDLDHLGGKYLSFLLGEEEYGVQILKVREIIAAIEVTPLPKVPDYVLGVINLRGRIIPVIDLRLKLGLPACESTPTTCIVVLNVGDGTAVGALVDAVREVLDVAADDVEPAPRIGSRKSSDLILGIGKLAGDGDVVTLIDIERAILDETVSLADMLEPETASGE